MLVDTISGLLVALLTYLGWRSGLLRQVIRFGAIIAVFVVAPGVSPLIKSLVYSETGAASPGVEVKSLLIAAVVVYSTLVIAGWVLIRVIRFASNTLGCLDRVGGATFGAMKALLMVYLAVVLVVLLEGPLRESDPENKLRLREGHLTEFVNQHNVVAPWQFPDLEALHQALRANRRIGKEGREAEVRGREEVTSVLRDERFRELLVDEELMEWVVADHYPMTLADARVRALLKDRDFGKKLLVVDWENL